VEGGAETVVDALLDVVGAGGTVCVPSFVFSLTKETNPIFDVAKTPSEMGAISEAARRRTEARRSAHLIHSIAAIGPAAEEITRVQGPSAWACDGPFWQLHERDAKIVLLGVPYLRCTYFHVVEQLVQTPKRVFREIEARVRLPDGTLGPLPTRAFVPTPGWRNNDFNKFGALLESWGLVRVGPVGNAVTRVLRARDIVEHGVAEYRRDPDIFNWTDAEYTPLRDGVLTDAQFVEKAVYDPGKVYGQ
jgi:aminoglycoside 3-N-acetyltransferase